MVITDVKTAVEAAKNKAEAATEVEAPAAKNEKWLQQRSMNAAKTLVGRK